MDVHMNSQRLGAYTGLAWVYARWCPIAEGRNGHKPPFLTRTLSATGNDSQMKNRVSLEVEVQTTLKGRSHAQSIDGKNKTK